MAPVVGAISVVGTIAGVMERNAATERQNRALQEQQIAARRSNALRLQNLEAQARFSNAAANLETMQRDAQSIMQNQQVQLAGLQNQAKMAQAVGGLSRQDTAANLQDIAAQFEVVKSQYGSELQALQKEMQATGEASQVYGQLDQEHQKLAQALQQGNGKLAAAQAQKIAMMQGSNVQKSRSDKAMQSADQRRMEFAAQLDMLRSGAAGETIIKNIVQSQEFGNILRSLGLLQGESIQSQSNAQLDSILGNNQATRQGADVADSANRGMLANAPNQIELARQTGNNQTNINRMYQQLGLQTQGDMYNVEATSQIQQMEAAKQPGIGPLSSLLAVGQAGLPFLSLLYQDPAQPGTQGTPSGHMYDDIGHSGNRAQSGVTSPLSNPMYYNDYQTGAPQADHVFNNGRSILYNTGRSLGSF
jgi:hypothetical protein